MTAHVAQVGGALLAKFQEVESGKRVDRPQLAAALATCRTRRAVRRHCQNRYSNCQQYGNLG